MGPALTPAARRQDDSWSRYADSIDPASPPPFDEQLASFQSIYAARDAGDGPPLVWRPGRDAIEGSNAGRFMRERGFRSWGELHAWSARERATFWQAVIDRLGIRFTTPPSAILDLSRGVEDPLWLPGASMCIVDSCFKGDPASPAVISAGEDAPEIRVTSRGELAAMAGAVAAGLRARGLGSGDAIALYMPMTLECVAAYLGIIRAGCAAVSIADSFPAPELKRRMEIAGAASVVTAERFTRGGKIVNLLEKVRAAAPALAVVVAAAGGRASSLRTGELAWEDLLAAGRAPMASSGGRSQDGSDPGATINVLFSSGTTGTPKAIPWSHLTPIKCAMDGHFHQDIRRGDVVAWPTNIGWMMGPWLIFASLINDAAMALWEGAPLGDGFRDFVREARVTMLGVVPSLVRAWRTGGRYERPGWDRLRLFSSTGEPSSREDYLWLMSLAGYRAPVIEYLGGTEIGGGHITGSVLLPASPATFTTPALGIDFHLLDAEGRPAAEGGAGELFLVPPAIGLSQRLLNADHTAVYYAGAPRGPSGEKLRRHGDEIVRLPHGFFRARGRTDDTMNLGGVKISALEIEQVVEQDEAVLECAAVAVQVGGEGAERLVLHVVPAGTADPEALLPVLGKKIARDLNPLFRIHDLVLVPELPRTASNKLMRRELRSRYEASATGGNPPA